MILKLGTSVVFLLIAIALIPSTAFAQGEVRAMLDEIDPYRTEGEFKGKVTIVGSGSMAGLSEMWGTSLKHFHPDVTVDATGGGSEEGLKKLAGSPGIIAAITRPVVEEDIAALKKAGLKDPVAIVVGLDALAVFVHKNNPIESIDPLTLQKLYSDEVEGKAENWGAVGIKEPWDKKPVVIHERGDGSGTQTFVQRYLLGGKKIRPSATKHDSNSAMIAAVGKDEGGIAIGPIFLKTDLVRALPLELNNTKIEPKEEVILKGGYPLIRPLCLVYDRGGKAEAVALIKNFVRFAISRDGQLDTIRAGYFPLNCDQVRQQQDAMGLELLR